MASTEQALSGLVTEVAQSIKNLVPNRPIQSNCARFVQYNGDGSPDDGDVSYTPIIEGGATSRLFEIHNLQEVEPTHVGYTTEGRLYSLDVTICYLRTMRWTLAAMDDLQEIRHWFLNNQGGSGVSGIACRYFPHNIPATTYQHPSDPWDYYTLIMHAWTDITFS